VAIAAGIGLDALPVHRRPVVGILATGDEIRRPGQALGEAGIPDANGPALVALVAEAGGDPRVLGIADDRLEDIRARLCAGLAEDPDLLIVSGGVSVGPYDHVRTAFQELGEVQLWRVAVQPGKPFAFATTRSAGPRGRPDRNAPVLLFGLPGNPVAVMVTFYQFVREALLHLSGRTGDCPGGAMCGGRSTAGCCSTRRRRVRAAGRSCGSLPSGMLMAASSVTRPGGHGFASRRARRGRGATCCLPLRPRTAWRSCARMSMSIEPATRSSCGGSTEAEPPFSIPFRSVFINWHKEAK